MPTLNKFIESIICSQIGCDRKLNLDSFCEHFYLYGYLQLNANPLALGAVRPLKGHGKFFPEKI